MGDIGREGHRERLRQQYKNGAMLDAPDHNTLELFLSLVITRRVVMELSYELINTFGSLEGVFSASPEELMKVKGVGETTAVALSMVYFFHDRLVKDSNKNVVKLDNKKLAKQYCINELRTKTVENFIQINLRNDGSIIKKYVISQGTVSSALIDKNIIYRNAVSDNAAYTIVAHNHPHGEATASANDINFTISLYAALRNLGVKLIEHFVVAGDEAADIVQSKDFKNYFKLSDKTEFN